MLSDHSPSIENKLTGWAITSAADRRSHSNRVANLARRLARALEEEPSPRYGLVYQYMSDDSLVLLIKSLTDKHQSDLLRGTGFGDDNKPLKVRVFGRTVPFYTPVFNAISSRLVRWVAFHKAGSLKGHFLPDILRRLADSAEQAVQDKKPDQRPNTGSVSVRVFCHDAMEYLKFSFDNSSFEIIAILANLKFPGETLTGENIREYFRSSKRQK